MTIVTAIYSWCAVWDNTQHQLALCEVGMVRKSRRRNSVLLMLLFIVALSFVIVNLFGQNLYTVVIVILALATLVMIGMIVGKQRQKIVSKKSGSAIRGKWAAFLALGVVGIGILVLFIATPTINWFRQNLHTIITVVLVLAALATAGILVWINRRKLVPKGIGVGEYLHEYTREPRNMKDGTLASEVWQKIVDFRCKRHYEKERDFQHELYRWLENEYPNRVEWEHKKGMSRADISIGRIAIEIKGPTGNSQLREAIRQIGTYGNDYDLIIFVLFKPQWGELYFDTFTRALSRFSHVGVITNSG